MEDQTVNFKITLDDPQRAKQLELKMREYEARFEVSEEPNLATEYAIRIALIKVLLEKKEVAIIDFFLSLQDDIGQVDNQIFDEACGVIRDYVENGGTNCVGGTGLPMV